VTELSSHKIFVPNIKSIACIVLLIVWLIPEGFSQEVDSLLNRKISFTIKNILLEEALHTFSEKSGLRFSYNAKRISTDTNISIDVENVTVKEVLDMICTQAGLTYESVEKQIILKKAKSELIKSQIGVGKVTLSGFIRDADTGEILIGAAVYLSELETGTISNAYGFYSITLPQDSYSIKISYIGYNEINRTLNLSSSYKMDIQLSKSEILMEEIIVIPDDRISFVGASQMSNMDINPGDLMQMPAFLGEGDVIKSLQSIPGIQLFADGSTMFFVRGGDRDQNLILLDEAPIYNPSHLLGLFSTFIPDAVKDINIYKGDIPASYGSRLSSLIDIKTNDGNLNRFSMNGSIGMLSTKLGIEAPIVREKGSFFLSGRMSQVGWVFKRLNDRVEDFYFYDVNSKLNWKFNDRNRIFLTFYSGADLYSEKSDNLNSTGINWKNNALTFRWNHVFSKKLFSNTTLYASSYDYALYTSIENSNFWNSSIANLTLKSDFSWFINPAMTLYSGFAFSGHNINPGNFFINNQLTSAVPYVSKKHNRESAFYAENDHQITKKLNIRYGIRLSIWENTGEAIEIEYNQDLNPVDSSYYPPGKAYHSFSNLTPRISLSYQINPNTALKASYTRTAQYLHLINNSISPFTTLDVWLPSGPNIPDQTANQIASGIIYQIEKTGILLSSEIYYKKMKNQIDYIDHAEMLLNPFVEGELRFGNAWSYGLEVLAEKKTGRLRGWMGYAYSRAWRQFPDTNNGLKYPAFYDRPNEFSFMLIYDINSRVNTSMNWYYASGSAITTPSGFYYFQGHTLPLFTEKNNDRFPNYHRLDVSFRFRLNKNPHRFQHYLGLSIYNLYGRKNPVFINFNKIETETNVFKTPGDLGSLPNLITTQTFIYNVIPSINYHFQLK